MSVSAALNSISLYLKSMFLYERCEFLCQKDVAKPVQCEDGLLVGVISRIRFHETCPELLKELLRGSFGVLGET